MADIDIVPKHGSRAWLWIVLAIIIIAIVWIALSANHRANTVMNLAPSAATVSIGSSA